MKRFATGRVRLPVHVFVTSVALGLPLACAVIVWVVPATRTAPNPATLSRTLPSGVDAATPAESTHAAGSANQPFSSEGRADHGSISMGD